MKKTLTVVAIAVLAIASHVHATETITYTYDAKGRLVQVVHSGSVNNNVQTQYTHDKSNNRKTIATTGSPNPPPP